MSRYVNPTSGSVPLISIARLDVCTDGWRQRIVDVVLFGHLWRRSATRKRGLRRWQRPRWRRLLPILRRRGKLCLHGELAQRLHLRQQLLRCLLQHLCDPLPPLPDATVCFAASSCTNNGVCNALGQCDCSGDFFGASCTQSEHLPHVTHPPAGVEPLERASAFVSAQSGGVVALTAGDAIAIPPGALAASVAVSLKDFPDSAVQTRNASGGGGVVLASASSLKRFEPAGLVFLTPVPIALKLTAAARVGVVGATAVYYFNTSINSWDFIGGTVDADVRLIRVNITHFSIYAAFDNPAIQPSPGATTPSPLSTLSGGAVAGIVIAIAVAASAAAFFVYRKVKRGRQIRSRLRRTALAVGLQGGASIRRESPARSGVVAGGRSSFVRPNVAVA